jgi:hypothetical protein
VLDGFFTEHVEMSRRLYREHTEQEMRLLLTFVRRGRVFNERRAAEVEAQTRERPDS